MQSASTSVTCLHEGAAAPGGRRCLGARRQQQRASTVRPRSTGNDSRTIAAKEALEVVRNDIHYLEQRVESDWQTVAAVHDELVGILNPTVPRQLEEQIAGLQQELAVAHMQVHKSEEQLEQTVRSLTELESNMQQMLQASGPAAPPSSSSSSSSRSSRSAGPAAVAARPAKPTGSRPAQRPQPPSRQQAAQRSRRAGLQSSLDLPEALKDHWFPLEFSSRLQKDVMIPLELFGQAWVLFRDAQGRAACVHDECAHRACPLSLGRVVDGELECPYHGWRYDAAGSCTRMPSTAFCKGVGVTSLPVTEEGGLIWVWPGSPAAMEGKQPPVAALQPPPGFKKHAELVIDVPVDHGLLIENLLDLAHAPFTHTTTFAKGWPIPDAVRFHAANMLDGRWDPYPIDMSLQPPCMVLSTIGLTSPGKIERGVRQQQCTNHLHQLHVCLPAGRGRTRLLYVMSLDFMHWTRFVPGIQAFWSRIAGQVLGEDLVLVKGQQDRMLRGGNVWGNPVPYDKLGVRYRRWRNSIEAGDKQEQARVEAALRTLSAGELFSAEDSQDEW